MRVCIRYRSLKRDSNREKLIFVSMFCIHNRHHIAKWQVIYRDIIYTYTREKNTYLKYVLYSCFESVCCFSFATVFFYITLRFKSKSFNLCSFFSCDLVSFCCYSFFSHLNVIKFRAKCRDGDIKSKHSVNNKKTTKRCAKTKIKQ